MKNLKYLVVNGCSFSRHPHEPNHVRNTFPSDEDYYDYVFSKRYSTLLADKLNVKEVNLSTGGSSNDSLRRLRLRWEGRPSPSWRRGKGQPCPSRLYQAESELGRRHGRLTRPCCGKPCAKWIVTSVYPCRSSTWQYTPRVLICGGERTRLIHCSRCAVAWSAATSFDRGVS